MPKTLTGQELQLDDGPARDSELFLVDGNNLAYRAFFALPEELSPARRKNILEHAEQARRSKELATMRRDLDVDCDPAELVLAPPDRGTLRETFRRFEFRALLNRIDDLDAAVPAAAPTPIEGE